jgi:hypothetical protein
MSNSLSKISEKGDHLKRDVKRKATVSSTNSEIHMTSRRRWIADEGDSSKMLAKIGR